MHYLIVYHAVRASTQTLTARLRSLHAGTALWVPIRRYGDLRHQLIAQCARLASTRVYMVHLQLPTAHLALLAISLSLRVRSRQLCVNLAPGESTRSLRLLRHLILVQIV